MSDVIGSEAVIPFTIGEAGETFEGKGIVEAFVEGLYLDRGEVYKGNGILGAFWLSPWEPFAYYIFRHRIKAPFLKKRVRQIFFNGEGQIIPQVYRNFQMAGRQEL